MQDENIIMHHESWIIWMEVFIWHDLTNLP
jgi:hypothetical protein